MSWAQYRDGGFTGPIAKMFNVTAIPHTFTIDVDGVLQEEHVILGNSSREVELKLAEILGEHAKKIIFDLSGVTILDSTGIGILVVCQGKIHKARGRLHIAGVSLASWKRH